MLRKLSNAFTAGETVDVEETEVGEDVDEKLLEDKQAEILEVDQDTNVLDTEYERRTIKKDLAERKQDLTQLQVQIRNHWENYQYHLDKARREEGLVKIEAKGKAKEAKKAAKDKEKLYKLLWKEMAALRNALRTDEQIRILKGGMYIVDFEDVNKAVVEEMSEEHRSVLRTRDMNIEQFQESLNRDDEEIEMDFDDIEKDVAELEMQDWEDDIEVFVEPQAGVEEVPETDQDWS